MKQYAMFIKDHMDAFAWLVKVHLVAGSGSGMYAVNALKIGITNMPTYDFHCGYCIITTEVFAKFDEQLKIPTCPKCGSMMSRIYSTPGIQFKGTGFYKTDNK